MKKLTRPWLRRRLIQRARWHPSVAGRFCENPEHVIVRAADRCDACGHAFCDACLRPVELWRVCGPCLARLQRERNGPTWPQRWRRLREARRGIAAGGVLLALFAVVVLLLEAAFGSTGAASSVGAVARNAACLQSYPDPTRLYLVGGVSMYAAVPARLELRNCFFDPGERVQVQGRLDGWDTGGDRLHEVLGPRAVAAGVDGELAATLDIPDNARYIGSFRLELTATGDRGNQAGRVINAGEQAPTWTVGKCPPFPLPCLPGPRMEPTVSG